MLVMACFYDVETYKNKSMFALIGTDSDLDYIGVSHKKPYEARVKPFSIYTVISNAQVFIYSIVDTRID